MKKLLILVLLLCLIGLGFYRGWVALSGPDREKQSGKINVGLSVDPDKVKEDAEKVKEKTMELTDKVTEEVKNLEEE